MNRFRLGDLTWLKPHRCGVEEILDDTANMPDSEADPEKSTFQLSRPRESARKRYSRFRQTRRGPRVNDNHAWFVATHILC